MTHPRQQFVSEKDTVAVYTINVQHEPRTVVNYKEFPYKDNIEEDVYVSRGELTTYTRGNFDVEVAKVESITDVYIPKEYPYKEYIQKSFYVIEPRLEKIVSAKYKDQIEKLNDRISNLNKNLVDVAGYHIDANNIIANYNSLPWWKKLFTFKI